MDAKPKIGWSNFALEQHRPGQGRCYFTGPRFGLIDLLHENWTGRKPGYGRSDLCEVVVVTVPPNGFVGNVATIRANAEVAAKVTKRREGENLYIENTTFLPPDPVRFAKVVLYSRQTLLHSGEELSGDYDWEIVALIAGSVEEEPMHPLTIARNFLQKPGGTFAPYTAQQFAEAIWYWADKVRCA